MIMSYSGKVEMSYFKLQCPDVIGGYCDGNGMITMSRKETKRLHIIHQALYRRITQKTAAELVG